MRKLYKVLVTSIVFAGCSTTAFAVTQDTALKTQAVKVETSIPVKDASTKKVVRMRTHLPKMHHAKTQSTRTVLFYSAQPTRTKKIKAKKVRTSTPNLFNN